MKTRPGQPSLRGRAVELLARREHSRSELTQKLSTLGSLEEINVVLDQLEQTGLLSDARMAAAYVRGQAARSGTAKLRHLLRGKGINSELIESSLAQEGLGDELQRARALWLRRYGGQPNDAGDVRESARRIRYMQSRGFSMDIILKLANAQDDE